MSTSLVPITELTGERPTPDQIDELAVRYAKALADVAAADVIFDKIESEAIALVQKHGVVPPNAEASRRLEGRISEFTVTTGNSVTIDEARVQDLKGALDANGFIAIFPNLFQERTRHELVKGADVAIVAAGMPKRLTEKVLAMFGRCFDAKKKSPSLKVKTIAVTKAKKAKKVVSE
jgi:hypothetical protein